MVRIVIVWTVALAGCQFARADSFLFANNSVRDGSGSVLCSSFPIENTVGPPVPLIANTGCGLIIGTTSYSGVSQNITSLGSVGNAVDQITATNVIPKNGATDFEVQMGGQWESLWTNLTDQTLLVGVTYTLAGNISTNGINPGLSYSIVANGGFNVGGGAISCTVPNGPTFTGLNGTCSVTAAFPAHSAVRESGSILVSCPSHNVIAPDSSGLYATVSGVAFVDG